MTGTETHSYTRSLDRFRRGYNALFALLDDLPDSLREKSGACGDWTPKQVLAHLSGWVREANQRYFDFTAGDMSNREYDQNDDWALFNSQLVQERAHLNWEDTVEDLRQAVHLFSLHADQVNLELAAQDSRYEEWLVGLWNDCVEHMGQLCQFITVEQRQR